jgi:hypothetical protein
VNVCNFFENYTRLFLHIVFFLGGGGAWILQTVVFVSFYVSCNEKDAEC